MGLSYDWERELATCEPEYYRWNQWIFLQFFKKGLAYKKSSFVNWCPSCETVLANEQVIDGACWRCDSAVVQKELEQWFFRITDYAEELLNDLDKLDRLARQSSDHAAQLDRQIDRRRDRFSADRARRRAANFYHAARYDLWRDLCFARRRTSVGAAAVGRHGAGNRPSKHFIERIKNISQSQARRREAEKEGVFTGAYCRNPFTGENIPIYLANFVLMEYGTGAVMAVPAHDQRDFEFARKYSTCRFVWSFKPQDHALTADGLTEAYVDEGVMVDSGEFSGLANSRRQREDRGLCRSPRLGQKSDSFSPARLGRVAPALLGHADSDHLLRQLRHRAGA